MIFFDFEVAIAISNFRNGKNRKKILAKNWNKNKWLVDRTCLSQVIATWTGMILSSNSSGIGKLSMTCRLLTSPLLQIFNKQIFAAQFTIISEVVHPLPVEEMPRVEGVVGNVSGKLFQQ